MSLLENLRAHDKKGLFQSNDTFVNYSTGFLPLDYANGFYLETRDKDGNSISVPVTGIMGGTFITIIGYSGTGKTTLADQIAASIINNEDIKFYLMRKEYAKEKTKEPFLQWLQKKNEESLNTLGVPYKEMVMGDELMIHVDSEHTALKPRINTITNTDPSDPRIILKGDHVAIEDVLELIDAICKEKDNMGDEAKYVINNATTEYKDIKVFLPTVIIIDSLYTFNSRERSEDKLDGSMTAGREVKEVAQFYTKCLNNMKRYNITIICINHLKEKIVANPYDRPAAQLMLLRPSESMPRGLAPIFLAQNCFKLSTNKTSMYDKSDMGFEGMKVTCQIAKSKTQFVGASIPLAFNKDFGFDPIVTLYEFAVSQGLIEGRNPYLYIRGSEAFKFNRKDFRNKFIHDNDFRINFMASLQPYLEAMLGEKDIGEAKKEKFVTVDSITSMDKLEEGA